MGRIKVRGRYFNVDDLVLEIPGLCQVDFKNSTVTKYPENTICKIESRLLVLLDYLCHRDGYTSLDTIINDLYDGYAAEGSVKADINNLRKRINDQKLSDGNYQVIQNVRGRGYRLLLSTLGDSIAPISQSTQDEVEPYIDDEGTVIDGRSYAKKTVSDSARGKLSEEALLIRMRTGEVFPVQKKLLRIGSSSYYEDMVDVVLFGSRFVNRVHAEILCREMHFFLREPKPSNATRIDGHILKRGESAQLGECTELVFGDELFFFLSGSAKDYVLGEGRVCAICSMDSGETRLLLNTPLLMDRYHPWRKSVLMDQKISRSAQAKVYREDKQSFLMDLGSKNGTFCNNLCLVPGEAVPIYSGDSIVIVDTVFSYYEVMLTLQKG